MYQLAEKRKSDSRPVIQTSLKIGQPGDKYEQEADAVADRVMMMSDSDSVQMQPVEEEEEETIQMMPNEKVTVQMKCKECEDEEMLQTKRKNNNLFTNQIITKQLQSSNNYGFGLSDHTNHFMSKVFGSDFSEVKVHAGTNAAQMNQQLGARAFTNGRNIYFNQGEYNPESSTGKGLLAHELTHVVQQGNMQNSIQCDYAVAPITPNRMVITLTNTQIQNAITYNQSKHTDADEISLLRDILGLSALPSEIDEDFINALVQYQAEFDLIQDGRLGHDTADRLAREVIAEGDFLGSGNLGTLEPEFQLRTNIRTLISADNRVYDDYKQTIQAATMIQQHVALNDLQLLRDLKSKLSWNNWARCIELLGRSAPTGNQMTLNLTVRAAMRVAWTASNPAVTRWPTPHAGNPLAAQCDPVIGAPATAAHEEGGFIYLNLTTGTLSTMSVAAGGQASLPLNNPTNVADSIVVGGYHTHPNVGNCWGAPFFSQADINWSNNNGVPLLMIGAFPGVANTSFHAAGSARRHIAGNRGLPGAAGGLAPQSTLDGKHDEL